MDPAVVRHLQARFPQITLPCEQLEPDKAVVVLAVPLHPRFD